MMSKLYKIKGKGGDCLSFTYPEYDSYYNPEALQLAKWSIFELYCGNRTKASKIKLVADKMEYLYRKNQPEKLVGRLPILAILPPPKN